MRHRPASFTSRTQHLFVPNAGSSGNPLTFKARTGRAILSGDEVIASWSAATQLETGNNPDYALLEKASISGLEDYSDMMFEGEKCLAPAQWPTPSDVLSYNRVYPGLNGFLTISQADAATKVTMGEKGSGGGGFRECTILSDAGTGNFKDHYATASSPATMGSKIALLMVGARVNEYLVTGYNVSTGLVTFLIPDDQAIHEASNTGGWLRYAMRYNPFDIRKPGQFARKTGLATTWIRRWGSGDISVARVNNGLRLAKSHITLQDLSIERMGGLTATAILQDAALSNLTLDALHIRGIQNMERQWSLYFNNGQAENVTINDFRATDCHRQGAMAIVTANDWTINGFYCRNEGRTPLFVGGNASDITIYDIDVSDQDSDHGNGAAIYQACRRIKLIGGYLMNRERPLSVQTNISGDTRDNEFTNLVCTTKKLITTDYSQSVLAYQGINGETGTIIQGCIFGFSPMTLHPSAGGAPSTGMIIRNCVISSLNCAELPGISFENCLIFKENGGGRTSLTGTGATDLGGNVFAPSDAFDGTITIAIQQALTRLSGGGGYVARTLGVSDRPWLVPAYGAAFALTDGVVGLTTTEVAVGRQAGDTFASEYGTMPGSVVTIPSGLGDNALFGRWKGQYYFLADAVAGSYNIHIVETNSHPDRTGSSTKTTIVTVTVS